MCLLLWKLLSIDVCGLNQRHLPYMMYRRPSLFVDFISANLLIHFDKIGQK
jgi:hypothetical protein